MNMSDQIKRAVKEALWQRLEELDWPSMSDSDHSAYYEQWTRSPEIGGKLGHFMDPRAVRVYIKDTLVKDYAREKLQGSADLVLRLLKTPVGVGVSHRFIKPHGLLLSDGRTVSWANSRDWKHLLMAAFERQREQKNELSAAVVIFETGKTVDSEARDLVSDAARRLSIEPVLWWD